MNIPRKHVVLPVFSAQRPYTHRTYRPGGIGVNNGAAPMKKIRCRVKRYEKRGVQREGARLGDAQTPVAYQFAGFRLEPARRALTRPDGTAAHLSSKPFDTLVYLVERAGELVDRDELLHGVWPKRVIEDNNLNQAIATLRRILGEQHVVTVAGRGYQFVTPVRRMPLPALPTSSAPEPSITRTTSPPTASAPSIGSSQAGTQKWRLRWPVFAAFAAGLSAVALFAVAPSRTPSREPRRNGRPRTAVDDLSRGGVRACPIAGRNAGRILVARPGRYDRHLRHPGRSYHSHPPQRQRRRQRFESGVVARRRVDRVPAAPRPRAVRRHGHARPRRRGTPPVQAARRIRFPWRGTRSSLGHRMVAT